jgi:hypothetical protein
MTNEVGRPPWATIDPCFRTYFNTEWGMPVRDAFASLRPQSSRQQPGPREVLLARFSVSLR